MDWLANFLMKKRMTNDINGNATVSCLIETLFSTSTPAVRQHYLLSGCTDNSEERKVIYRAELTAESASLRWKLRVDVSNWWSCIFPDCECLFWSAGSLWATPPVCCFTRFLVLAFCSVSVPPKHPQSRLSLLASCKAILKRACVKHHFLFLPHSRFFFRVFFFFFPCRSDLALRRGSEPVII